MKLRVIWIDDMRDPRGQHPNWRDAVPQEFLKRCEDHEPEIVWIKTYTEWVDWLVYVWNRETDNEYVNCFCLDHDLGCFNETGEEITGVTITHSILDELTRSGRPMPYYECHSSNPTGRDKILSLFNQYKKYFYE